MKFTKLFLTTLFLLFLTNSCHDSNISIGQQQDENEIFVPDTIIPEVSEDDPQQLGIPCTDNGEYTGVSEIGTLMDLIEIPNLSATHDLSNLMPPVRSQGQQGSCVGWATAYYLKSYQEKIQYEYEYTSYSDVMSPAYVYNQIKGNNDCMSGSNIGNALDLLKEQGCTSWKEFPYSDAVCSASPDENQKELAKKHKIKDWYSVGVPKTGNLEENYTLINIMKTLISQGNPLVIGIYINRLKFQNINGKFTAITYERDPNDDSCGHAMLITGYDDTINAFKVINSWGTGWGNDGYCWMSYNFFKKEGETNYQKGLQNISVAYDDDEE